MGIQDMIKSGTPTTTTNSSKDAMKIISDRLKAASIQTPLSASSTKVDSTASLTASPSNPSSSDTGSGKEGSDVQNTSEQAQPTSNRKGLVLISVVVLVGISALLYKKFKK